MVTYYIIIDGTRYFSHRITESRKVITFSAQLPRSQFKTLQIELHLLQLRYLGHNSELHDAIDLGTTEIVLRDPSSSERS